MKFIKIEENQNLQPKVPRTFVETPMFQTQWKKNGLNDSDLQELQNKIMTEAPEADLGAGYINLGFLLKEKIEVKVEPIEFFLQMLQYLKSYTYSTVSLKMIKQI